KLSNLQMYSNTAYVPADSDGDSVRDTLDNCVSVSNYTQDDVNRNGRGDACDDFDRDALINSKDNCPNIANYDQRDTDSDGVGDVCDGEESRITEKYPWLPWVGIGAAALVLLTLFVLMAKSTKREGLDVSDASEPPAAGSA